MEARRLRIGKSGGEEKERDVAEHCFTIVAYDGFPKFGFSFLVGGWGGGLRMSDECDEL